MPAGADGELKLGDSDIDKFYLGDNEVDKIYLGENEIWTNAIAPILAAIQNQSIEWEASVNISLSATGTEPLSFSATGLPSGLSINQSTGIISGSSIDSGAHTVTVSVSNSAGSMSQIFTLTVTPAPRRNVSCFIVDDSLGNRIGFGGSVSNIPTGYTVTFITVTARANAYDQTFTAIGSSNVNASFSLPGNAGSCSIISSSATILRPNGTSFVV